MTVDQIHYISNVLRWLSLSQVNNTHIYSVSHLFQERSDTLGVNNLVDQVKKLFRRLFMHSIEHSNTDAHTRMVQKWFQWLTISVHCCLVLSGKPVITLHFKMLHYKCQRTQTFVSQGKQSPPSSHTSSTSPFERTGDKAAFVISNLSRMERRGLHYILRLNKDRTSTLVASLKHEHAKCTALHFHSLPSSVSHVPVSLSLCILLYRDWAVGRRLQSLLLRITANWRC